MLQEEQIRLVPGVHRAQRLARQVADAWRPEHALQVLADVLAQSLGVGVGDLPTGLGLSDRGRLGHRRSQLIECRRIQLSGTGDPAEERGSHEQGLDCPHHRKTVVHGLGCANALRPYPGRMRIRPATLADLDALGALKLRASLALGEHLEALQALAEARSFPPEHLPFAIVAEAETVIAGFATVLAGADGRAELEDLFVEPDLWRRGIGRGLIAAAEARALASGAQVLRVVANSHGFYLACGFELIGETETLFGPAPVMEKRVSC